MNPITPLTKTDLDILRFLWDLNGLTLEQLSAWLHSTHGLCQRDVAARLLPLFDSGLLEQVSEDNKTLIRPRISPSEINVRKARLLLEDIFHGQESVLWSDAPGPNNLLETTRYMGEREDFLAWE